VLLFISTAISGEAIVIYTPYIVCECVFHISVSKLDIISLKFFSGEARGGRTSLGDRDVRSQFEDSQGVKLARLYLKNILLWWDMSVV
jgi:hypothetical protein